VLGGEGKRIHLTFHREGPAFLQPSKD